MNAHSTRWKPSLDADEISQHRAAIRSARDRHFHKIAEQCRIDPIHFCRHYVKIEDTVSRDWVPFNLWDGQADALTKWRSAKRTAVIKARQQGFTWLALADALHEMVFNPIAVVLVFSKTDREAMDAVGLRLAGMYDRLPEWMRAKVGVESRSNHALTLNNGSRATAFPTTGGRSYSGTLAIVDEADYVENLDRLLAAVKPTVDAGGRLLLISTTDKSRQSGKSKSGASQSPVFKSIYRAGLDGGYQPLFYPWSIRPERTQEWYEQQKREYLANYGTLDLLHQEYPATADEALAANVLDKRFPPQWVAACFDELPPMSFAGESAIHHLVSPAPSLPALKVFRVPIPGRLYVLGADPAEGNPTSDDSAFDVLDVETREQVATLSGKFEPAVFASMIDSTAQWYNRAGCMVERNNHGHAVLMWLRDNGSVPIMSGLDGNDGWLTNSKGKSVMWDRTADALRAGFEKRADEACVIHDCGTMTQLQSIEGASHSAPEGEHDDRAVCYGLALCAAAEVVVIEPEIHFGPRR